MLTARQALGKWQKEQKPSYEGLLEWAKKNNLEIMPECIPRPSKKWHVGICEEGVRNPDFAGLRCGRIELSKTGDDYPSEDHICLPEEIWDDIVEIIDNY